nr:hypothetical protein [Tanacetum cinerariifolium]
MDKSRSYPIHDKHQALFEALFNSLCLDDVIARGQADPEKILRKRDHDGDDKDEDPSAGPNQEELVVQPTKESSIELEYNMEECYKALSDQLDQNNPEGDRCPFDLSKSLPLKGRPGH